MHNINYINAFYYLSNNFGDNLNHYLIKNLSGKPCVYNQRDEPHYIVCGTILNEANYLSTVWGAGFGDEQQYKSFHWCDVRMTRGFKSSELLGIDLPIAGDPALLLPLLYTPPEPVVQHQYGIIPHWTDYKYCLEKYSKKYHIIDPFLPVEEFINEVTSCLRILSTGLHGLIVADSYGVLNRRLILGDIGGDGFKFDDYYSTTDEHLEPLRQIQFDGCKVHQYKFDKQQLLKSCPFA